MMSAWPVVGGRGAASGAMYALLDEQGHGSADDGGDDDDAVGMYEVSMEGRL